MNEKYKPLVEAIVNQLANLPYGEVLNVINEVSVRIFVCAPEEQRTMALEDCHGVQRAKLEDFIREKETQKAILDESIGKFSQFGRGAEGSN